MYTNSMKELDPNNTVHMAVVPNTNEYNASVHMYHRLNKAVKTMHR